MIAFMEDRKILRLTKGTYFQKVVRRASLQGNECYVGFERRRARRYLCQDVDHPGDGPRQMCKGLEVERALWTERA